LDYLTRSSPPASFSTASTSFRGAIEMPPGWAASEP